MNRATNGRKWHSIGTVSGSAGHALKVEVGGPDCSSVCLSIGAETRRSDLGRQLLNVQSIELSYVELLALIRRLERAAAVVAAGRSKGDLARIEEGRRG